MRKRVFTSTIAALALFAVVGLVAALAPSLASLNLARAQSLGGPMLYDLTVTATADGTAQRLVPAFYSTDYFYEVHVDNSVSQVTVAGTPGGDATVTAAQQVNLPAVGATRVNVVVSLTAHGTTTMRTYTVLVIRKGTTATDRAALMALYNSAGGADWTNNTNWGSTEPLDTWFGIIAPSHVGRVMELKLEGNNLVGTLPDALGNLDRMEWLLLSRNQLSGSIPASLGDLANLRELYLYNNELTGPIPDLGSLTILAELYLGDNELTGSIPDLGRQTRLTDLALWDNQLTGEIPGSLNTLTKLVYLYLGGNTLSGTIPDLSSLTKLQALSLWGNDLSGSLPTSLGSLTSLTTLDISRNNLDGPIPDLSSLTSLQWVYLWDNQLSGEIPATLNSLTSLNKLYLNRNALSGTIPDLSRLTSLTHLYLNHNQLSGAIPATLNSLNSLEQLALSFNQLDGPIPTLSSLTSLTHLYLSHNQLSGTIPSWLDSLTSLVELRLSYNELSGTIPDLRSLTSLTQLFLRNNELTGEIPAWLGQRTNMTHLYLSVNQLSGDFPAALGNLDDLRVTRFASNPSLTGCVPLGLRYLLTAPDFESTEFDPDRRPQNIPAQDFIPDDPNGDGDTDDPDDIPGLHLPFCMLSALEFSDVSLTPTFASATAAYTASVANTVESTTVTATLASSSDRLSIRKGTASYSSGAAVPLAVGPNEITITVTPTDGTPTLTYTVTIFREGVDRATLIALYNSAGGASWTSKDDWGETGVAIGMWEGVTTNGSGSVTALDLPGNNLSGTLPAALGTLTSLTTLDLSGNRLSGTIPDLGALSSLTTLNLGDNQLSETIPDWLGSLTGLQDLSLRDNRLTGPIPEALGTLNQLDVLYLDDNQLSGPIPDALSDLNQLDVTRFAGNALTGCVPNGLRYLVTAPVFDSLPAHDFIAVDANTDGDTADDGDTPGLGLPFCTLESLTLSGVTLEPAFASDTVVYTPSADHAVTSTTVRATLHNSSDTVSITKGADTYTNGDSVPLEVGTNVITITVTPEDGTPTHTYTVTVTRAPNTLPTFDEGLTTTRGVDENTTAGQDIGDPVRATDTENDTLTYSLDATSAASLDIDESSGQLLTKAALDFEDKSSYTVTVSVRDSKDANGDVDEVTDDMITVTILVADLNEAPEFPISETGMRSVDENTVAGVNIGAPVAASDDDDDPLTYSLDVPSRATFDIVATTGRLQTKAALDYETGTHSYTVIVTAADPSGLNDTIEVTITVGNVDEKGTVTLSTVQPIAGIPLTATLDDRDDVDLVSVTWSWRRAQSRNAPGTLISGATAATYTPVAADVGLFVRATASYTDGEGPDKSARSGTGNRVGPARVGPNERPEFPSNTAARDVNENTVAGVNIGEPVAATDPEGDTLTYSLDADGAASFDIVATTGQLRTKAALDFETPANYFITVTATDTAGATDTITVTITVNNIDEPGTVTLSSLQPIEGTQLTATLDDPDDVSGSVTWLWERSPNGTSPWTTISGASDSYTPVFDDVGDYLRATASYNDGEGGGKSAQAISANAVEVAPVVNEAPVFTPIEPDLHDVDENTVAGENIGAPVAATDDDNDTLTYSLDVTSLATFDIVATTGQLQTKAALDYETGTISYTVTVTAVDPSGADDTITVTITVTNVDEAGTVTLSSTQPVEEIRLTATLDDPDDVSGSATWLWAGSPNGSSSWTTINGETSATYTPVAADVTRFLRATASYTDGAGSGKSAHVVSANRVQAAPAPPNEPPQFPSNTAARDVDENTSPGEDIGEPVTATDPEDNTLTYSLDADGAASFDIGSTTGQLRTKAALDHETTATYSVTVTATDTAGATDTIRVTITVNNVDEPATVTLSSLQPLVVIPLTATLTEPDQIRGSVIWSWERSPNGTSDWNPISGATSDIYTPVADDVGNYLRATASYFDEEARGQSAQAISANAVEMVPERNAPVFTDGPTTTRSIPRNTPAGVNIGAPVSATDADNDVLTYSLGGPDGAGFDLDTSSGQLLTRAELTGIQRTIYKVFVSVSDSKDDLGNPDTAIDTTTEVTINVTTTTVTVTTSSGSSSSSSGGGRRRATPTPTPTPSPTPTATPTPTGPQFSGVIAAEPSVTATVVPEGTTLGLNGGGDLPGGVYVNFPPTAVALPVPVSISVSNEAPDDVTAPSGTTLLPLTINITPETPLILGTPLTIEINPTPEQLAAAGGDLNHLAVGVVTPHGVVVLPTQVMHGRLVVTTDRIAPFVLLAITDSGPVLTQPPPGDASSMGPLLQWTQPPGTTWFQVQVIPFNEDGPGINLVIGDGALVQAAQYQVLGPNFGSADPNYVMLPGMTYLWRVRTSTVLTNPTAADWSAWAVSSFKTPPASSSTITRVAPPFFGEVRTLTPTLTWANSNPAVFYYEVQVSRDFEFGPNAFLYSEYVHGGASTPANSYVVPEAFPLEAGEIYYWRVRPRIQGDGDPLPWSAINVFLTPG